MNDHSPEPAYARFISTVFISQFSVLAHPQAPAHHIIRDGRVILPPDAPITEGGLSFRALTPKGWPSPAVAISGTGHAVCIISPTLTALGSAGHDGLYWSINLLLTSHCSVLVDLAPYPPPDPYAEPFPPPRSLLERLAHWLGRHLPGPTPEPAVLSMNTARSTALIANQLPLHAPSQLLFFGGTAHSHGHLAAAAVQLGLPLQILPTREAALAQLTP